MKWPLFYFQGLWGRWGKEAKNRRWFVKKTWSKKSRDTVPLKGFCMVIVHIWVQHLSLCPKVTSRICSRTHMTVAIHKRVKMKQYALLLIEVTWSLFMVLNRNICVEKMRFPRCEKWYFRCRWIANLQYILQDKIFFGVYFILYLYYMLYIIIYFYIGILTIIFFTKDPYFLW